jgi:two-component sensor histidine kinase
MNLWNWIRDGWRKLLVRTAVLTAFWLLLAFIVATEFYFMARSGPVDVTWAKAAIEPLRDWLPWILLSPVVVAMADLVRFERQIWKQSLFIHLAACAIVAVAYETLLTTILPRPDIRMFTAAAPSIARTSKSSDNMMVTEDRIVAPTLGPVGAGLVYPRTSFWRSLLHRAALRTQFTAPIYWCIVCFCWVLNHFQETRERERRALELEKRLTQANLQALKMQLQPHFLFNTLNAISSLIHENPKAADDMLCALSQFLRMNLAVSSKNEVALQQELDFVDRYLEIQQTRFGERLRINRQIDPSVKAAMVPPLILQPLVENAIRHGLESRETGGTVTIRASRDNGTLRLEISDDGEGFKGGKLFAASEGIGLSNTKARLSELYGENHEFRLMVNKPSGARVTIAIPYRTHGEAHFSE